MGFRPYVITYTQDQDYNLNYDRDRDHIDAVETKSAAIESAAVTVHNSANDTLKHSVNNKMNSNNNKILRPEASIYVQFDSSIAYADSLANFLLKQGLILAAYQDKFAYKADDVILLSDKTIAAPSAKTFYIDQDKARLWAFLKQEFRL